MFLRPIIHYTILAFPNRKPLHYSCISKQKKTESNVSVISNELEGLVEWLTEFSLNKAKIELIKFRSYWKQLPRDLAITCNNHELFIE